MTTRASDIIPKDVKQAVQTVLEYLHEEEADFETSEDGSTPHIAESLQVIRQWLTSVG